MSSASSTDSPGVQPAAAGLTFAREEPHRAAPRLDAGSIHVWRIAYDPSERRAPLLRMLAAYLDVPVAAIELRAGAHGKPELQAPLEGARELQFNWSHSGNYALIALARGTALGVDIERIGKPRRALGVARRFFAADESSTLAALEPAARKPAFTGLWCAKEAVLKAAGTGLSFGLDRVVFAHLGGALWEPVEIDPALGGRNAWRVPGFGAAPDYRGALAWQGAPRTVVAFELAADSLSAP